MHEAGLPPDAALAAIAGQARRLTTPCGAGALVWHVWGEGAPILLLHGNHGSWRHWARNVLDLAERFTVLVPDLPGNGESDLPPLPASLVAIADIVESGLRAIIGDAPLRAL